MIEIRICEKPDPKNVGVFGTDAIVVRFKEEGKKTWESRGCGDEHETNRLMLERAMKQVMRMAFPEVERQLDLEAAERAGGE